MIKRRKNDAGMTLVEVLVAAAVIVIIMVVLGQAVVSSSIVGRKASYKTEANSYATGAAEILANRQFSGSEEGFIVVGAGGLTLIPSTAGGTEPAGASGLRYTAATSVVQGQNAVRIVVGIYNHDGLQTQAITTYTNP